jgi:hypothetical protein
MYRLRQSSAFLKQKALLEPQPDRLDAALSGVYFTLERTPDEGEPPGLPGGCWTLCAEVLMGLLMVTVFYTIEEDEGTVTLRAIVDSKDSPPSGSRLPM